MNGSANSMVTKIARIFGTNASVISWICVNACTSEIATPTTRPTSISGDETSTMVQIASRATSSTSLPVIANSPTRTQRLDRHPHDVFVGLDHFVAHRHQRFDRNLGFGDGSDDVDHIGLA